MQGGGQGFEPPQLHQHISTLGTSSTFDPRATSPVPEYLNVIPFEGGMLSAQQVLPGRPEDNPSPAVVDLVAFPRDETKHRRSRPYINALAAAGV